MTAKTILSFWVHIHQSFINHCLRFHAVFFALFNHSLVTFINHGVKYTQKQARYTPSWLHHDSQYSLFLDLLVRTG